jgi:hypothetical protein
MRTCNWFARTLMDAVGDTEQVLHMMPDLVRADMGLREVAGRGVARSRRLR